MARATADVICDWDLRAQTLWWSDDVASTFGYAPDTLAEGLDSWSAHVHPDDLDRVMTGLQGAVARREPFWQDEYRYIHRDGRVLHVEDRGCLVIDDQGEPVRFVRGMADITARVESQVALRERLKELRCLYRVVDLTTRGTRSVDDICGDIAAILPDSLLHADRAVARIVLGDRVHASAGWSPPWRTSAGR